LAIVDPTAQETTGITRDLHELYQQRSLLNEAAHLVPHLTEDELDELAVCSLRQHLEAVRTAQRRGPVGVAQPLCVAGTEGLYRFGLEVSQN
jgi:hypothetical protein